MQQYHGQSAAMRKTGETTGSVDAGEIARFAAMADKDLDGMFSWLDGEVMVVELGGKRAADGETLRRALVRAEIVTTGHASSVFDRASQRWERVAVFGSIYLLGEWFAWAGVGPDELATLLLD